MKLIKCDKCAFEYNGEESTPCPVCKITERTSDEKMNSLIKKYPHLYGDKNPTAKGGRYYMQIGGFECGSGWYDLLDKLSENITKYLDKNPIKGFHVQQVKEKFGGLCYYTSHYDSNINQMISDTEKEATNTCERCGSKENVKRRGDGWIVNWCGKCEGEYK